MPILHILDNFCQPLEIIIFLIEHQFRKSHFIPTYYFIICGFGRFSAIALTKYIVYLQNTGLFDRVF